MATKDRSKTKRLALPVTILAALFFIVVAAMAMIESQTIPYATDWAQAGQTISKRILYYVSVAAAVTAFAICISAIFIFGWKKPAVVLVCSLWISSIIGHFVVYEWWPTPERMVIAAVNEDIGLMKWCFEQGVDVDARLGVVADHSLRKQTALSAAVIENRQRAIKFLLDHGANPDLVDGRGIPPLHKTEAPAVWDQLLEFGADIEAKNSSSRRTLVEQYCFISDAVTIPDLEHRKTQITALVDRGAILSEHARFSALNQADFRLGYWMERFRSERKTPETNLSLSFLSALALADDATALAILHQHPEWTRIRRRDFPQDNYAPGSAGIFQIAVRTGRTTVVREWLQNCQDSEIHDWQQRFLNVSMVSTAAVHDDIAMLKLLKEFGADTQSHIPLFQASRHGKLNSAKWLIDQGAELDPPNGIYGSAIENAIWQTDLAMVRLLTDGGALLGPNQSGKGMFDIAVSAKSPDIAKFLVTRGVKPDSYTNYEPWVREILDEAGIQYRK